jgi:hypothetical protein
LTTVANQVISTKTVECKKKKEYFLFIASRAIYVASSVRTEDRTVWWIRLNANLYKAVQAVVSVFEKLFLEWPKTVHICHELLIHIFIWNPVGFLGTNKCVSNEHCSRLQFQNQYIEQTLSPNDNTELNQLKLINRNVGALDLTSGKLEFRQCNIF